MKKIGCALLLAILGIVLLFITLFIHRYWLNTPPVGLNVVSEGPPNNCWAIQPNGIQPVDSCALATFSHSTRDNAVGGTKRGYATLLATFKRIDSTKIADWGFIIQDDTLGADGVRIEMGDPTTVWVSMVNSNGQLDSLRQTEHNHKLEDFGSTIDLMVLYHGTKPGNFSLEIWITDPTNSDMRYGKWVTVPGDKFHRSEKLFTFYSNTYGGEGHNVVVSKFEIFKNWGPND